MQYKILSESSTSRLEGAVHFVLKNGGSLVGGPFSYTSPEWNGPGKTMFAQAVMEHEREDPDSTW